MKIFFSYRSVSLMIAWGLILEFPIRYLVSPDPWINSADHWYFTQPNRILIETGFVLLAILPFIWIKDLKDLLVIKWTKNNILYLILGILGSILIFTLQQWEELITIEQNGLWQFVPIWFATGLVVGIGQELSFRGLIYTGFLKKYGIKWAIALSTLCFVFGSIHSVRMITYFAHGYIFEMFLLLFIFLLSGLFFVWVRIETKNIIIPAIIHGVGNAITWSTFIIVKLHPGI